MSSSSAKQPQMQQGATRCNNIFSQNRALEAYLRRRNDLQERQKNAIDLLLQGRSDQEVAAQIGVDRTTIFRWRKTVAFQRELDRQRRLMWDQSANQLQSMVQPALEILHRQLVSDDPKSAMRAASVLLRFATPSRLARFTSDVADDASKQFANDVIAYCESPLPGQPGAPEDMVDDEDEDFDEEEESNSEA